jgi:hypothetical protein
MTDSNPVQTAFPGVPFHGFMYVLGLALTQFQEVDEANAGCRVKTLFTFFQMETS